jgi:hypothetical protein
MVTQAKVALFVQLRIEPAIRATLASASGPLPDGSGGEGAFFLVDLPVDVVIVLEQQERTHQPQRPNETQRRFGFA